MKKTIKKLQKERKELMERIDKIDKAIKSFQDVCTHKNEDGTTTMEFNGYDSHHDYYKCSICGFEI